MTEVVEQSARPNDKSPLAPQNLRVIEFEPEILAFCCEH